MALCEELGIDPESDSVLFCLATDLGSKVTGEWEKEPFVKGIASYPGNIDSLASLKSYLPTLRKKLNTDPAYFKKVYMHVFTLAKGPDPSTRTLQLDTAVALWTTFIPPALSSNPSSLSRTSDTDTGSNSGPPQFTRADFDLWIEFIQKKGKAVSKDTWSLLIDFIRSIDKEFKEYDDEGAWPSTIDDFVEFVGTSRNSK
nr:defective in Cullin neddylation protein 1 [Kwoniella dejecticola CBS 10117]OBR88044.1 defective in Cullin neddylation protein 1 [Kwoniella dejecticola CBS 10117]